jgi:hypothetical protein
MMSKYSIDRFSNMAFEPTIFPKIMTSLKNGVTFEMDLRNCSRIRSYPLNIPRFLVHCYHDGNDVYFCKVSNDTRRRILRELPKLPFYQEYLNKKYII